MSTKKQYILIGILILVSIGMIFAAISLNHKKPVVVLKKSKTIAIPSPSQPKGTLNPDVYTSADKTYSFDIPKEIGWSISTSISPSNTQIINALCASTCSSKDTITQLSVLQTAYKTVEAYLADTKGAQRTTIATIPAAKSVLTPSSSTQGPLVEYFVTRNQKSYSIKIQYTQSAKDDLNSLPTPQPDILSSFKFL